MTVDGKKNYEKVMFTTEEGNFIISSCIICFADARKYSEEILRRLTFKYFEKVAEFSIHRLFLIILKHSF